MRDKDTHLIEEQYKNLFEQDEKPLLTQEEMDTFLRGWIATIIDGYQYHDKTTELSKGDISIFEFLDGLSDVIEQFMILYNYVHKNQPEKFIDDMIGYYGMGKEDILEFLGKSG